MRTFSTSRKHFIAGSSALLAVTACSGGGSLVAPAIPTSPSTIPDMLKSLGYAFATDPLTKQTYYATGYEPPAPGAARSNADCLNYASGKRSVLDACGGDTPPDPTTEGAIEVNLPLIGTTGTTVVSPPVTVQGPQPFVFYAVGGFSGGAGSTYGLPIFNMMRCLGELNGFIGTAWNAVRYIAANESKYSQAIVNSANAAIAMWGGTGMGISAAATFLFGLMSSLTTAEWLGLCLAIGLTASTAYVVFNCLANGMTT